MPKPVPESDSLTAPFWRHANERRLAIQRCLRCRTYYHPPVSACYDCLATELEFEVVSGRGTIYSFTITHDARQPAFQSIQPYPVVVVQLEEQGGLFLFTNLPSAALGDLRIGAAVVADFEELDNRQLLPQFRLATAPSDHAIANGTRE